MSNEIEALLIALNQAEDAENEAWKYVSSAPSPWGKDLFEDPKFFHWQKCYDAMNEANDAYNQGVQADKQAWIDRIAATLESHAVKQKG